MRRIKAMGRGAAICAAALATLLPYGLFAQAPQKKQPEKPQVVNMGGYKVSAPPGGNWKVEVNQQESIVSFSKIKGKGVLSMLAPTPQQRATFVMVIPWMLEPWKWRLTEDEVMDEHVKGFMMAMGVGEPASDKGIEKGETEHGGKKLRFAAFHGHGSTAGTDSTLLTSEDYLIYFYFPPDFKKIPRFFVFQSIFSRANSLLKLYKNPESEPVLAVIDSLEIVDPLQAAPGPDGELIRAAAAGDVDAARRAIEKGAVPDASYGDVTALAAASFYGRREIVELLLEKSANIDLGDKESGLTPLHQAILGREPEIAAGLIERGANVNAVQKNGFSPLMYASGKGQADLVSKLIERGADIKAKTGDGETALLHTSISGSVDIAKSLLENGSDLNQQRNDGYTLLMLAIGRGQRDLVNWLLETGADVKLKTTEGWTALMEAISAGDLEIVRALIEKGADVNPKNKSGLTPLMWAAASGEVEIVKLLLEKGADVNAMNDEKQTALKFAKKENHKNIVRILQAAGAK